MEAGDGIEPSHGAFAEPGLTTWLPRRYHCWIIILHTSSPATQWRVEGGRQGKCFRVSSTHSQSDPGGVIFTEMPKGLVLRCGKSWVPGKNPLRFTGGDGNEVGIAV